MRSITVAHAALFAAVAMLLLTGHQLIDNAALLGTSPLLIVAGGTVPSLVWAGFFFVLYGRPASAKTAAWIALVFAVLLEALAVCIRFQQSVSYWTPFDGALSLSGWLLRLGWAVFLISFALSPNNLRTRRIALVLAILSAPSALSIAYDAFNNGIGFLIGDMPRQALWRALITPVIRTVYWVSQILFLWTAWGNPRKQDPVETSFARLAP
jgi:hypothetical protein